MSKMTTDILLNIIKYYINEYFFFFIKSGFLYKFVFNILKNIYQ